jgi:hypothetical protein
MLIDGAEVATEAELDEGYVSAVSADPSQAEAPAGADCDSAQPAPAEELSSSEEPSELLILLDWDDTIMPTTYLQRRGIDLTTTEVPEDVTSTLSAYGEIAANTLRALLLHGTVVIVTNAEWGWVELTAARFLPAVEPLLRDLECISARSTFEPKGFVTPAEWKEEAFAYVAQCYFGSDTHQRVVVSIGDSKHEKEAVQRLGWRLGVITKSVKLQIFPDLNILQREHEIFQAQIEGLFAHEGALDIQVTV